MTKREIRILYLLTKAGGSLKKRHISHAMARTARTDRERTLADLEELQLISSAILPGQGRGERRGKGPGGLAFWLTEAGRELVAELIASGEMKEPNK